MRFIFLLFLFPSLSFAVCPVGVTLGSDLSTSTNTPPFTLCVANSQSTTGYCTATCGVNGSCASYGSAGNYKAGPFVTTGAECQGSDSGGSNGSDSGSGSNPTTPNYNAISFGPVLGSNQPQAGIYDAQSSAALVWIGKGLETGLTKMNDNLAASKDILWTAKNQISDNLERNTKAFVSMTSDINSINSNLAHTTNSISESANFLKSIDDTLKSLSLSSGSAGSSEPSQLEKDYMQRMEELLFSVATDTSNISQKIQSGSSGGSSGGNSGSSGGTIDDFPKSTYWDSLLNGVSSTSGMMQSAMSMWGTMSGNSSSINSQLGSIQGYLGAIEGNTSSMPSYLGQIAGNSSSMPFYLGQIMGNTSALNGQLSELNGKLDGVLDALSNQSSGASGTGGGDSNGSTVGTSDNPAHLSSSSYKSNCSSDSCYFDKASAESELKASQDKYKEKIQEIKSDIADAFKVNFDGEAKYPKCFELYSYHGKSYKTCTDSGEYFSILQSLMMFIFIICSVLIFFKTR